MTTRRPIAVVAPRAGAWIETCNAMRHTARVGVAPRAGAWIETACCVNSQLRYRVAPRAGAWIETRSIDCVLCHARRAPCGRVD